MRPCPEPLHPFALCAVLLAAGCTAFTPPPSATPRPLVITVDAAGRARTELTVLSYNVAGLPWPVRWGRGAALDRIGTELAQLRAAGTAPHVVLLQEAFTARARRIGVAAGYPYAIAGPDRHARPALAPAAVSAAFRAARRWHKGEGIGKFVGSGLYVYSEFPPRHSVASAFGADSCAGYDCLANKGVVITTLDLPGLPAPVQIMNTHLNARRAAGVPRPRTHDAHRRQIDEIVALLHEVLDPAQPFIFGGDFNTRRSHERYLYQNARLPGTVVRYYCTRVVTDCAIDLSWDGDEPWMDTQDLQGFAAGHRVRVRPVRVAALFDAPHEGRMLSDHDGYLVTYELSWDAPP